MPRATWIAVLTLVFDSTLRSFDTAALQKAMTPPWRLLPTVAGIAWPDAQSVRADLGFRESAWLWYRDLREEV